MTNEWESENYVAEIVRVHMPETEIPTLRNIIGAATYAQRPA